MQQQVQWLAIGPTTCIKFFYSQKKCIFSSLNSRTAKIISFALINYE